MQIKHSLYTQLFKPMTDYKPKQHLNAAESKSVISTPNTPEAKKTKMAGIEPFVLKTTADVLPENETNKVLKKPAIIIKNPGQSPPYVPPIRIGNRDVVDIQGKRVEYLGPPQVQGDDIKPVRDIHPMPYEKPPIHEHLPGLLEDEPQWVPLEIPGLWPHPKDTHIKSR